MKFGQELVARERERFRGHYLNYRGLKRLLKELAGAKKPEGGAAAVATSTAAAARFVTELQREVTRINVYVAACQMQLDAERGRIEGACLLASDLAQPPARHPHLSWRCAGERRSVARGDMAAATALAEQEREVSARFPRSPRSLRDAASLRCCRPHPLRALTSPSPHSSGPWCWSCVTTWS